MQTENNPQEMVEGGWTLRVRPPVETGSPRTMLLVHGLAGDEKVMWVFAGPLPRSAWLIAPRAPVALPDGGYSWVPTTGRWPRLDDLAGPAASLMDAFERWSAQTGAPLAPLDVMGFSQGAALSYAVAALYPGRVDRVIAMAGFLPVEDPLPGRYAALNGKKIYIAHGSRDETVPVGEARRAVETLDGLGAEVRYCESDVGHKLSAGCLKGLGEFLQE